jgi:hypothetical protein
MSEILVTALTSATLEGNGVFDVLMRANKAHLEAEFSKNRIKGPEYATVYLGSLQQVLQAAMTFVLTQQKAALEAQLLEQQILTATAQRALVVQQTANALIEHDNLIKQGCVLASQFDLNMGQVARVASETLLINQKMITEKAQTTAQSVDESSVVGRQKALYQAQTAGFARNAEQAATKLLVDTWSIRRTTDTGTIADGNNQLNDATIGRAVSKMLAGVGA